MTWPPLLSVLIPAVGGQGGGVLSEWIVDAADLDEYRVHGTSIPGVAQRTGSTTYYVELATARGDRDHDSEPVFCLYPVPGALDVLVAPEFLEVGRMLELGFVSPERTTVIASTHRLYSIHEKIATGDAIYPFEELARGAAAGSRRLIAFDALALAREHGTEANAVLLGALAGSGALPIRDDAYRQAIERRGVAVKSNLVGFDVGLQRAGTATTSMAAGAAGASGGNAVLTEEAPAAPTAIETTLPAELAGEFGAEVTAMPEAVRPVVVTAIRRLVDYQDRAYARRFLERLRPFAALDTELGSLVARHLAVLMTYEDAVRVAELKTRWGRFERIRAETRAGDGALVVTDYLKPDLDEIWGVLPRRLVAPFVRWAERRWPHGRPTLGQHVRTTTVTGYLRVRMLAWLRPLRPVSYRFHEEQARIEGWLDAVRRAAAGDLELARELARAAQLVKGYGDVRRRMGALFERLLASAGHATEVETRRGGGAPVAAALARRFRELVLTGPDGEAEVEALASRTLALLEAGDRTGALAALTI
ncbi:MAG: indolepyruvate oxidoreductase subunit beta family protein [Candidatus Rokuibacteriota bacterium]